MQEEIEVLATHHHQHHEHHDHTLTKIALCGMVLFSIGYMIGEPNLDGFNIEEAMEYIKNAVVTSQAFHITGFITSFISNIPMLAAILYYWAKHHHHHDHSLVGTLLEYLMIGGPFALMGCAAYLSTMEELTKGKKLNVGQSIFMYIGAAVSSFITGLGSYKLHSFHVHDAMTEHGGGVKAFIVGLYTTFFRNVWAARVGHDSKLRQALAVMNEGWKKYGILFFHALLGYYAANIFLIKTGLAGKSLVADWILKIGVALSVMVYEGNTEARSLDYNQNQDVKYSRLTWITVILSGLFHSIGPLIAAAMLIHPSSNDGPGKGVVYNLLAFVFAAILFLYPSVYGFTATTIPGFHKAAKGLNKAVAKCAGRRSDYQEIETSEGCCSKWCSFFSFRRGENEPVLINASLNSAPAL